MKTITCDYCKKPIDTVEQNIELHISCAVFPANNRRLDLHRGLCFNNYIRALNTIERDKPAPTNEA